MKENVTQNLSAPFLIMTGCVLILFVLVVVLVMLLVNKNIENYSLNKIITPYKSNIQVHMINTNKLFTGSEDVDFVGIGLAKRKISHFEVLSKSLKHEGIELQFFEGINGKDLRLEDFNLSPRYINFFENNRKEREEGKTYVDYRGHLGCTISHLTVIENIERMTVILEDDADLVENFRAQLQQTIADTTSHDPDWELIVLGCSAKYDDHPYHKLNDREAVYPGGIVKLHYWIGGWAYVIRDHKTAQKILTMFNPISWHIDLTLAEKARLGHLKAYGRIPTIARHPGWLRLSSWDFHQYGDPTMIKTDTNS